MSDFKRAFSTLAFYRASVEEIISIAKEAEINAIEVRLDDNDLFFGLENNELDRAIKLLDENGITVCNIGTTIILIGYDADVVENAKKCLEIAAKVKAKGMRVFLGYFFGKYSENRPDDYEGIVRALKEIAGFARDYGVEVWVETHNNYSTSDILFKILEDVGYENVKIIWDVMHPIERGEMPDVTSSVLKDKIAHVHIKDGIKKDDEDEIEYHYTKLGEGSIPIEEVMICLDKIGYEGYISLEWEDKWRNELKGMYDNQLELLGDFDKYLNTALENCGLL